MTQPIFLIGPRGCGKTTVGHALARALKLAVLLTEAVAEALGVTRFTVYNYLNRVRG